MRVFRWLYPGIGIKRWLILFTLGMVLLGFGVGIVLDTGTLRKVEALAVSLMGHDDQPADTRAGIMLAVIGFGFTFVALNALVRSVYQATVPRGESLGRVLLGRRQLERGPKIVAVGGGSGLSVLLRGLKEYTDNVTALVTVSDDGGSSGRLRQELGILPPGDIRNCLLAMADTEPLMQKLFEYRFKEGGGLRGHNFGNLFIAAMTDITGDFEEAVRQSSKVLAVRGRVLPITLDNVRLCAELDDGSVVTGETRISASGTGIKRVYLEPEDSTPLPEALNAIKEADAIVLGPGSLYTSVLSTLSVPKISQAIAEAPAVKIYVCNVMTQPGETSGYTLERHVQAVLEHAGKKSVDVVLHNSQRVPEEIADRYRAEGSEPVEGSVYKIQQMGLDMVAEDLLSWDGYIRHSSERLAKSIIRIILKHRGHVLRKRVLEMYWLPDWLKG